MKRLRACLVLLSAFVGAVDAAEPWSALVSPSNSLEFK